MLRGAVGNSAQLFVIIKRNGVDNNVVMYRIFIDMGSNDKLEFSIGKFHCKLAAQLMGSLRRDSIVRGKGLNHVVGKISLLFRTCISSFACHCCSNGKIKHCSLWGGIVT